MNLPLSFRFLTAALAPVLFLFAMPGASSGAVIFSGGGSEPLQVQITAPIVFDLPGGTGIGDTELIYFVFNDIYSTDNPSLEQEAFSSSAAVTPGSGSATFDPFSADVLDFDIGDIGPRDINFHWIADGTVPDGSTITLGVGTITIDAANSGIRVPDNLGSAIVIGLTTDANGFVNLDSQTVAVVPEPSALALGLLGTTLLGFRRRR